MASVSQPSPKFALNPSCLSIDRIALLPTGQCADVFFQEIFPHFCHCLVVSSDGAYPRDPAVAKEANRLLAEDESLRVVVFGFESLRDKKLATDRLLVLDDLVMQDFRRYPSEKNLGLGLDAQKISFLMSSFFTQWDKMTRTGNISFAYQNFTDYQQERFDWKLSLLTSASSSPDSGSRLDGTRPS